MKTLKRIIASRDFWKHQCISARSQLRHVIASEYDAQHRHYAEIERLLRTIRELRDENAILRKREAKKEYGR